MRTNDASSRAVRGGPERRGRERVNKGGVERGVVLLCAFPFARFPAVLEPAAGEQQTQYRRYITDWSCRKGSGRGGRGGSL